MAKHKKICTACGEEKAPNTGFYISRSKLYKFNDGRMPICKECLSKLFRELQAKYSDEVKALYHLCMLFDIYFDKDLVAKSSNMEKFKNDDDNLLKSYMRLVNSLNQYKFKDSMSSDCIVLDDSLINIKMDETEDNLEDDTKISISITPKIRRRWGKGYTDEEYEDLEYFYEEYKNNLDHDNNYMKLEIIKEMCTIKLIRDSAQRKGDYKTAREYSDLLSKKMGDGKLKPSQQQVLGEADDDIFGMKLLMYERYKPVPEVLEEYKDVDKFWKYILKHMIKPLSVAVGLARGEYTLDGGDKDIRLDSSIQGALEDSLNEE